MFKETKAPALSLTVLLGLSSGAFILGSSGRELPYSYGKQPSTGVIEVVVAPVIPPTRTTYTLFGDGRVEIRTKSSVGDERELESLDWQLESTELAALVDQAISVGLLDFSPPELPAAPVADGVTVLLRITLGDYAEEGEPSGGPLEKVFSISNPRDLARRYKEDEALAFIDHLLTRLDEIHKQARRASRP